ncbi:hypothetical protein VTO73DRAFT_6726 [Trametes versicolor]
MVAKKLFFKGVNLGKAVTLSLYLTTRSGDLINEDKSYTVGMPRAPWNVVDMPAKGQYEQELTWTGRIGFFDPEADVNSPVKYKYIPDSEIQLLNSLTPVQYHPAELLAYTFAEPHISPLLVQAVDNNGKPSDISLKLIEYSGTPQEIAHSIFTFKSNRDGLSVHGNPDRRMLSVHISPSQQDAALAKPNGDGPIGTPIGKFDMLNLDPSASILIQYNASTGAFTASIDPSIATVQPISDKALPTPDDKLDPKNGNQKSQQTLERTDAQQAKDNA